MLIFVVSVDKDCSIKIFENYRFALRTFPRAIVKNAERKRLKSAMPAEVPIKWNTDQNMGIDVCARFAGSLQLRCFQGVAVGDNQLMKPEDK